jgi:hypothetical protein
MDINNPYFNPSFYSHILNGFLFLIAVGLLIKNYSNVKKSEPYKLIVLSLLFSLAIGIHGLSHLGLEKIYNYNPVKLMLFK